MDKEIAALLNYLREQLNETLPYPNDPKASIFANLNFFLKSGDSGKVVAGKESEGKFMKKDMKREDGLEK